MKEITTKSGKKIEVYDDLFSYGLVTQLYYDLRSMEFPLVTQNDTSVLDYSGVFGFGKNLPLDLMSAFIKKSDNYSELDSFLSRYSPMRSWVNVYNGQHSTNRYHTDDYCQGYTGKGQLMSMLYYANPKWDLEWDGGTVFRSDDLEDVEYLSDYKPGRIVLFDSSIPHKIYQTSSLAHPYRFTVNTIFKNNNLVQFHNISIS